MAIATNLNRPRGIIPLTRGSSNTPVVDDLIPFDSGAGVLGPNMAYVIEADGNVAPATAGSANPIHGAIVGVLDSNKLPIAAGYASSVAGYAQCHFGYPGRRFLVQCDSAGSAIAATARGANADLASNGFDTDLGMATGELDQSSAAQGAHQQLRIVGLHSEMQPYNLFESAGGGPTGWTHNAPLIVEVNNFQGDQSTAGI